MLYPKAFKNTKYSPDMQPKHRIVSYCVAAVILLFIVCIIILFPTIQTFSSPEFIRATILDFSILSFVLYVVLVTVTTMFHLPSIPIILAGGYVFGIFDGTILSFIGILLGSTFSFYASRLGGKRWMEKWVSQQHIHHFNTIFKKRGITAVLISYALPFFPASVVSLLLGLTTMKYRQFILLVFVGYIPRVITIILLGSDMYTGFSFRTGIAITITALFVFIVIFREKIKRSVFTELRTARRDVGIIESWFGIRKG